jgi:hypothetical protein
MTFSVSLQGQATQFQIMMALEDMQVLNMLNTRYVIYNPEARSAHQSDGIMEMHGL